MLQGGLRAILWVDTLQMLIMIAGAIALITVTVGEAGGIQEVISANQRGGRINFNS